MLSAAILAARSTVREKKNWQIHLNYVKQVGMRPCVTQRRYHCYGSCDSSRQRNCEQDFVTCLQLIEEQLRECNGLCEYPLYVKGK